MVKGKKKNTRCLQFFKRVHLLADSAHKAGRVIGLAQDRHHLPLHELAAVAAQRAVEPLEVQRAEAVAAPHEEAALSQVAAAHCGCRSKEGRDLSGVDQQKIVTTCGLTGFQATVISCRSSSDFIGCNSAQFISCVAQRVNCQTANMLMLIKHSPCFISISRIKK